MLIGSTNTYAIDFITTAIQFDADGSSSVNSAIQIGTLDWAPASVLATNNAAQNDAIDPPVIPWPTSTTKSFQTVTQAALSGLSDAAGDGLVSPVGLKSTFEITSTLAYGNIGTSNNDLSRIQFPGVLGSLGVDNDARFINEVTIYYDDKIDDGTKSNSLWGTGYNDGQVILRGVVVFNDGNFVQADGNNIVIYDQFVGDQWGGAESIVGGGSVKAFILVTEVDNDFFIDLTVNSLLAYDSNQTTPFLNTNPSYSVFSESSEFNVLLGSVNGQTGPDLELQTDPTTTFSILEDAALGCRVTGGGNDTSGVAVDPVTGSRGGYDGTEAVGSTTVVKGKSGKVTVDNEYTMGMQAGANTGKQPQPKGEISHTNHKGSAGQWTFHAGTASAPTGTEVDEIICSDEGWCKQARPAPDKQIDFAGIGTFRNIIKLGNLPEECAGDGKGKGANASVLSYNWFEVHIEDKGEPGKEGQHVVADVAACPAEGSGTDAFDNYFGAPVFNDFICEADGGPACPDFYRIRIYCGVSPSFDAEGNLSNFETIKAGKDSAPIYEVFGYIDGGNFQIHPPTGFDLK